MQSASISIATTATTVPPYVLPREAVKQALRQAFDLAPKRLAAAMTIFDNAQVQQRYSVVPLEYLTRPRSLTQTAQEYKEHAVGLARRVATDCLARAEMSPRQVDFLITVSCTGLMIPSVDAYLINDLGFRSDVRRLPITALGCAAGAVALSRARELVAACPGTTALVIAVELPTLTLQHGDPSPANIVSAAIFGDGAAAAVVTDRPGPGARIVDTESYLFPDSLDAMGFDLRDGGLHIVLSKDVPDLVRDGITEPVERLLRRHGLDVEQLSFFVLHPGGKKILTYLEEKLGLPRAATQCSWDVLRDYGNLSSASVLFVLHAHAAGRPPTAGAYGLMAAFGPGFSAELLLLQWT